MRSETTGLSAVIDANIGVRLVLPGPSFTSMRTLISRLEENGVRIVAPSLWIYEATSGLCKAVRFEQLLSEEAERYLRTLLHQSMHFIVPDEELCLAAATWTIRLRRAAAYDSFYLALAESLSCDLWTADRRLFNAVNLPWVRFVGENGEESREAATRSPDG